MNRDEEDQAQKAKEYQTESMRFYAWGGLILIVLIIGMSILVYRLGDNVANLNANVNELQEEVHVINRAAAAAEEASTGARDELRRAAEALEQTSASVSAQELREVFETVRQIRLLICQFDDPEIQAACNSEGE